MTTERSAGGRPPGRRPRMPRAALRAWAWIAGAISLFSAGTALAADAAGRVAEPPPRIVIVRRVIADPSLEPGVATVAEPVGAPVATSGGS